jgi:CBS domain-containing protein
MFLRSTTPDTPLVEAAGVLAERKMGCLPVVKEGRLVGILTEGDFVAMVARKQSSKALAAVLRLQYRRLINLQHP